MKLRTSCSIRSVLRSLAGTILPEQSAVRPVPILQKAGRKEQTNFERVDFRDGSAGPGGRDHARGSALRQVSGNVFSRDRNLLDSCWRGREGSPRDEPP